MAYEAMIHCVDHKGDVLFTVHVDVLPTEGSILRFKDKCYAVRRTFFDCDHEGSSTYITVEDVGPFAWGVKKGSHVQV